MRQKTGRERDVARIRKANRAAAVCRLMLGELPDWQAFLAADDDALEQRPRRELKAGASDVRQRLAGELTRFLSQNFTDMTVPKLDAMYDEIAANKGLETPLNEFSERYGGIQPSALAGAPPHATVVISLWGFQFRFPEDQLASDVATALEVGRKAHDQLAVFRGASQREVAASRDEVRALLSRKGYAARSGLLSSFNLIEAYLNGLAWAFLNVDGGPSTLSKRRRALLEDSGRTTIRDKLIKYPEIVADKPSPQSLIALADSFLGVIKPFRDSLVHPSPFSAPEKFGGYDKLRNVYRIDLDTAEASAAMTCQLIRAIQDHIGSPQPPWLIALEETTIQ